MPNRILRDGILDSEAVCSLTEQGELFYRRLMSIVDDSGRFEYKPSLIRARAFPLNLEAWPVERIEESLLEVSQQRSLDGQQPPLVVLYEVDGKKFLQISNFGQRERYIKYPGPEKGRLLAANSGQKRPNAKSESEALFEGVVEGDVSVSNETSPPKSSPKTAPVWGERFDEWWAIWPKKDGKAPARATYDQVIFRGNVRPAYAELLAGLKHFTERHERLMANTPAWVEDYSQRDKQHVPDPKTFLGQLRWVDPPSSVKRQDSVSKAVDDVFARRFGYAG